MVEKESFISFLVGNDEGWGKDVQVFAVWLSRICAGPAVWECWALGGCLFADSEVPGPLLLYSAQGRMEYSRRFKDDLI